MRSVGGLNMSYTEAIMTIVRYGKEFQAIGDLLKFVKIKNEKTEKENTTMSSCLKAIKKINRQKNEAIDALCDMDE